MRPGTVVLAAAVAPLLFCACGPKTMEARMRDAERRSDKAAGALDEAQRAAEALEPGKMEDALDDAKGFLNHPDINLYPEAGLQQDRYRELSAKLPEVKKEREKRDLERRLNAARDKVVPRVQALLEAVDALNLATVTKDKLSAIEKLADDVKEGVDDDKDLFEKDKDFAQWAKSQKGKADKALEAMAKGKKALAFIEGAGAAMKDGLAAQKDARTKKDPAERVTVLIEAQGKLSSCEKDASAAASDAVLGPVAFQLNGGKPQTPAQIARACKTALTKVDKDLVKAKDAVKKAEAKAKKKRK